VCEHQLEKAVNIDDKFDLPGKAEPRPFTFSQEMLMQFMAAKPANLDYCSLLAEGKASRNVRTTTEPAMDRLWHDNWQDTHASKQDINEDYCPIFIGMQDLVHGVRSLARDRRLDLAPHPGLLRNAAGGDTLSDWAKQQKTPSAPWSPPREDARRPPRNGGKPAAAAAVLQAKAAAKAAAPAKPDPEQWGAPKAMSMTMRRIREELVAEKPVSKERVEAMFARFKYQAVDIARWSKETGTGFNSVITERDQLYPLLIENGYFTKAQLKAASKVIFEAVKQVALPKTSDKVSKRRGGKAAGGAKAASFGDTEPDQAGDSAKRQKVGDQDESQAQLVATLSDAIKMLRAGDGGLQEQRPVLISGDLARRLDRIDEALLVKDEVSELKDEVSELKERIHQLEQTKVALQSDSKELVGLLAAMCGAAACNEQLRPVFAGLVQWLVLANMKHMQDTTQAAWKDITSDLAKTLQVELKSLSHFM
jgi:hypothetical protein